MRSGQLPRHREQQHYACVCEQRPEQASQNKRGACRVQCVMWPLLPMAYTRLATGLALVHCGSHSTPLHSFPNHSSLPPLHPLSSPIMPSSPVHPCRNVQLSFVSNITGQAIQYLLHGLAEPLRVLQCFYCEKVTSTWSATPSAFVEVCVYLPQGREFVGMNVSVACPTRARVRVSVWRNVAHLLSVSACCS